MTALIDQHGDKPISPWGEPPVLRIGGRDFDTATIPELVRLRGVPQVAKHHPEVDTFVHVLMAMHQARALTAEPAVHFAVLLHDLGKGVTPSDVLPRHYGHEEAGVPIVAEVCDRLGVPDDWKTLALLVCEHHARLHTIQEAKGPGRRRLLRRIGAYDHPERCELFILACLADARGRLGLERRDYPQADILRDTFARSRKDLSCPSPAEVAALLRALEWRNMLHGERNCPGCCTPEGYAHEPDCALDAMIRKCEGE